MSELDGVYAHGLIGSDAPWCYLIHLAKPVGRSQHHLGSTQGLAAQMARYALGNTSVRLMLAAHRQGIDWELARVWPGGPDREAQLRLQGGRSRLCPLCGVHPRGIGRGEPLEPDPLDPVVFGPPPVEASRHCLICARPVAVPGPPGFKRSWVHRGAPTKKRYPELGPGPRPWLTDVDHQALPGWSR